MMIIIKILVQIAFHLLIILTEYPPQIPFIKAFIPFQIMLDQYLIPFSPQLLLLTQSQIYHPFLHFFTIIHFLQTYNPILL